MYVLDLSSKVRASLYTIRIVKEEWLRVSKKEERQIHFHHFKKEAKRGKWCPDADSNHGHADFQSAALPTELSGQQNYRKGL